MNSSRLFVYKIIEDSGGAPCVQRGLLTLAICKPSIRRSAAVGDWIFAFGSNNQAPANRLVYIARVTKKVTDGQYYELSKFTKRGDCIYRRQRNGQFVLRRDARFHEDCDLRDYDVGESPEYRNATVLVSTDFRYFGDSSIDDWKIKAPALSRMVKQMCKGHRVNHTPQIHQDLLSMQKHLWRQHSNRVLGLPMHADPTCRSGKSQDGSAGRRGKTCQSTSDKAQPE